MVHVPLAPRGVGPQELLVFDVPRGVDEIEARLVVRDEPCELAHRAHAERSWLADRAHGEQEFVDFGPRDGLAAGHGSRMEACPNG